MIVECSYCESKVDGKVLAEHKSFGEDDLSSLKFLYWNVLFVKMQYWLDKSCIKQDQTDTNGVTLLDYGRNQKNTLIGIFPI